MKTIKEYWSETDEVTELENDLKRLDLEAQNVILEKQIELSRLTQDLETLIRKSRGSKGLFKELLLLNEEITKARKSLRIAEEMKAKMIG